MFQGTARLQAPGYNLAHDKCAGVPVTCEIAAGAFKTPPRSSPLHSVPIFEIVFLLLASFAFKVPALAGAADTSQVSPSGYKPWPSTDWQRIAVRHLFEPCADPMLRNLCAVRGNPRLLVCGIPVPLDGATISRRWMSNHQDVGNWADSPWKERPIGGARERASFDRVQQQPSSFNVTIFAVNAFFVRARHRYPVG